MEKPSLEFIAFLQALGLVAYCFLVSLVMAGLNQTFHNLPMPVLGPVIVLTLFVASALISSSIVLAYPLVIFWNQKNTTRALKLVLETAAWLAILLVVITTAILAAR